VVRYPSPSSSLLLHGIRVLALDNRYRPTQRSTTHNAQRTTHSNQQPLEPWNLGTYFFLLPNPARSSTTTTTTDRWSVVFPPGEWKPPRTGRKRAGLGGPRRRRVWSLVFGLWSLVVGRSLGSGNRRRIDAPTQRAQDRRTSGPQDLGYPSLGLSFS
jgi:hypothetical protein